MKSIFTILQEFVTFSSPSRNMADAALSDGQVILSYGEFIAQVREWTDFLQAEKPKCVALYADNSPHWVIVDLACQAAEIPFVPLPLFFSEGQLVHTVNVCAVDLLVTDRANEISVWFSADLSSDESLGGDANDGAMKSEHVQSKREFCAYRIIRRSMSASAHLPEGTAKITFTSGSTGAPKGVCLSLEQQIRIADAIAESVPANAIRHLCVLPLSTLLENVAGVYAPLLKTGEIVIPPLANMGFSGSALTHPERLLHAISQLRPHSMILLPELLLFLFGAVKQGWRPPEELEFLAVGGARVSPLLLQQAQALGLPVYEGYGLSECASVVSLNRPGAAQPDSVGKPLPHVNVSIEEGEVVVNGNPFLGYVGEPASWYPKAINTGDLGYIDDAGFLRLQGRKKNLLISSFGRNISPEWVESELLAGPLIAQAIVVGDAQPYCAALIHARRADIQDKDIQAWIDSINQRLPDYARIRYWARLEKSLAAVSGLLTENGRPRRVAIQAHFAYEIASLFASSHQHVCIH